MSQSTIYLDYAAATPLDSRVLEAMQPYFSDNFYNPSATYAVARDVRQSLDAARSRIGYWLGAKSSDIIFTAGGTEANNLAIHGIMRQYPQANVIVSALEHESVLLPARHYDCRELPPMPDGRVSPEQLISLIDDQTVLVSIMYANNEIGSIQPVRRLAQKLALVRRERQQRGNTLPLYLHTDACQAANYLDLQTARLGVDLMTLNGGKLYGPKQSGALFIRTGIVLQPLLEGGGQERGLRSGTENVAGAIGLSMALEIAQTMRSEETERLQGLQDHFYEQLGQTIPEARVNGSLKYRLPNNMHLTIPGQDNERLLIGLDEAGIQAAAGSACSASDEEPSHVLRALGLSDAEAQASLRFTMGRDTTSEMITQLIQTLSQLINQK